MSIYAMLRSLFTGRVSLKQHGRSDHDLEVAYARRRLGLTYLIHFLGILSINLAVLNFLPIPPLDGGQMVFLIAEKVRGRPLPDSARDRRAPSSALFLVLVPDRVRHSQGHLPVW